MIIKVSVNVIYLHTHDLGDWLSVYGRQVDTPNLDSLARESSLFLNAHAAAPTCSPSRVALLTGQNPHSAGMLGLAHRGFAMARPEQHLANLLQSSGYETILCGIQHEFANQSSAGFPYQEVIGQIVRQPQESHDEFQERRDREIAKAAVDWLVNHRSDKPFFLSVGFFQPHRPFPARSPIDNPDTVQLPASLPEDRRVKEDVATLRTSIRLLDTAVGMVIDALKSTEHWQNSIVLFTTDHGIAFPLHKCRLTDSGTKVALTLRHPLLPTTHGQTVPGLVSQLDVLPDAV
ncbi:MAG: sulfatase-like hydrolase/transferase [Verrucomicrobia bacterium]|nr:sulfatase-like hydrolase/transferase [Verrucomicrobiota bacterium]